MTPAPTEAARRPSQYTHSEQRLELPDSMSKADDIKRLALAWVDDELRRQKEMTRTHMERAVAAQGNLYAAICALASEREGLELLVCNDLKGRADASKAEGKRRGDLWLTPERWDKLKLLGSAWLAKAIDRAKLKEPK